MYALVTGASGGLGQAFCTHLASRGHDLVLASRRVEELERIAAGLRERHGVRVEVLPADLGKQSERSRLAATLAEKGIEVDVLVNNAGFGTIGSFAEADEDRMNDEIALNCAAVAHLTRLFLPAMLARDAGQVVNVASTAAYQPIPSMAVYAATKSFVLSLSQALWAETRRTGVRVVALCPGPTETAFFETAGNNQVMSRRRTPEQAVASAFTALEQRRPSVTDGRFNAVQGHLARVMPGTISAAVAGLVVKR